MAVTDHVTWECQKLVVFAIVKECYDVLKAKPMHAKSPLYFE